MSGTLRAEWKLVERSPFTTFLGGSMRRLSIGILVVIAVAAALCKPSTAEAQGRGAPPPPERGTMIIKNVMFDSVRIELRIGSSSNCEMNPLVAVRSLRKGRSWAIKADRGVCWRRERSQGSSANNAWTDWSRRVVPARATVRVNI